MKIHVRDHSELFFRRFRDLACNNHEPSDILDFWLNHYIKDTDLRLLDIIERSYKIHNMTLKDYPLQQVFPYFLEDTEKMKEGARNLRTILKDLENEIHELTGAEGDIHLIILVGAGTGAGHVTEFDGCPAILFGLENIARLGWHDRRHLKPLVYHELGHLIHHMKRRDAGLKLKYEKVWDNLYEEGVAQRFEQSFTGDDSWHMETDG